MPATPVSEPESRTHGRVSLIIVGLLVAVVLAAVAARFHQLGLQSYWTDEYFTVAQARKKMWRLLAGVRHEVHPPSWTVTMYMWLRLWGGTGIPEVARLLSAIVSVLGLAGAWWGLRRSALPRLTRWAALAALATSGFGIVYAQETRSYSMVWATAAVSTTIVAALVAPRAGVSRRRLWWMWTLVGVLATSMHLASAVLVVVQAMVLIVVLGWGTWRTAVPAAGLAVLPQLLWLMVGLVFVEGFAQGTGWIPAPDGKDVLDLVTTVWAWDGIVMLDHGFAWRSGILVSVMAALMLAATVVHMTRRRHGHAAPRVGDAHSDVAMAWGLMAGVMILGMFVGSQWIHLWTLRNMIVVAPVLGMLAVVVIMLLLGGDRWRAVGAGVLALVFGASLVSVHSQLQTQFKTDFAGTIEYMAEVRQDHSDATFVSMVRLPRNWILSADVPQDKEWMRWLMGDNWTQISRKKFVEEARPLPGVAVYAWYIRSDTKPPAVEAAAQRLIKKLGGRSPVGGNAVCRHVPMQGMVVVRCDR